MSPAPSKRSRAGRPRLPVVRRRNHSLDLRFSDSELFWVRWQAAVARLPVFCLVRDLALYAPLSASEVPQLHPQAVGQLSYIGHFLNQAMHRVNAGRLAPELPLLLEDLQAVLAGLLGQLGEAAE